MLRSAAQPGPAGAALDALRILLGTRLLPTTLVTLLFPLPGPLLAVAAVHAASVGLTVNNAAYCAAPVRPPRGVLRMPSQCRADAEPMHAHPGKVGQARGDFHVCAALMQPCLIQYNYIILRQHPPGPRPTHPPTPPLLQLLSHPLTRQRLRWLATAMHTASAFGEPLWFMQGPARA